MLNLCSLRSMFITWFAMLIRFIRFDTTSLLYDEFYRIEISLPGPKQFALSWVNKASEARTKVYAYNSQTAVNRKNDDRPKSYTYFEHINLSNTYISI